MQKDTLSAAYKRYRLNFRIAFEALMSNKIRSFLSALGIVFGVAAVISMLSIGKGTEQEILKKMEEVGVNSIVIAPFKQAANLDDFSLNNKEEQYSGGYNNERNKFSPGLTVSDARAIKEILPSARFVSPYIEHSEIAVHNSRSTRVTTKAVASDYFHMFNMEIKSGSIFTHNQNNKALPVCLLTSASKVKLLGAKNAIGKRVKIGKLWFTVVGVIDNTSSIQPINNNADLTVYLPINTFLNRIASREIIQKNKYGFSQNFIKNQLDKVYVQVEKSNQLLSASTILERLLLRKHLGVRDFQIEVPELLLKQQEETKSIFNIVLAVIAAISLIVGGIGIMNIMNASVLERTREIGVRMATGACKKDISLQFLAEAVLICFFGGIVGIVLGIISSVVIVKMTGILTIISPASIFIAFSVTTAVGIFFGFYPAKKASDKDPIESLRYE